MKKNLAILLSSLLLATAVQAEDGKAETPAVDTEYGGVTPSSGTPPSPKAPPKGYQYLTWPGFRATDTHAEIFLQLTGPVTHTVKQRGSQLEITLNKTKAYLRNNLRRVITQHFPGPVRSFRMKAVPGGHLRLLVELEGQAKPEIALTQGKTYSFFTVRFPLAAAE